MCGIYANSTAFYTRNLCVCGSRGLGTVINPRQAPRGDIIGAMARGKYGGVGGRAGACKVEVT